MDMTGLAGSSGPRPERTREVPLRLAPTSPLAPPEPAPYTHRLPALGPGRPTAVGKFLFANDRKLYVRGVTYGAFRPDAAGNEYFDLAAIDRDFALMVANGVTAVRIPHTTPPRSLLDAAQRHGLRVMVGLSAEQYIGYVIDKRRDVDVEQVLRERVRRCADHPALLCYALGNEIPAHVARWYGHRRVERYLERLYRVVKEEDPSGLVTYVNYPTTEYLELPFLDLLCYNVYLESQRDLDAYLPRLHNIAGDRPLIMSEIGLDALRNGEQTQARSVEWQIRTAFGGGCAGVFVFAWTDEWHRAGAQVDDWAFGITDRDRRPKPALDAVRTAFAETPLPPRGQWPRVSVVVCSCNGARTIRDSLDGLARIEYPNFEIIVVDDGSTDDTAEIVRGYDVRLLRTPNRGLSSARNIGLEAATGEIVAYLDDDAYPDPHWLQYLASTFASSKHVGVGGPNVCPPADGRVAHCVANAPGGPVHVLLSDRVAEHIPGCNMAFRREALTAIGGFDPRFRVAGDDVDICWRLQAQGWTLGFHPAAMVWHHRRNSVRAYWKQQRGYGRAEALLKRKWPGKYSDTGQLTWAGRIYSRSLTRTLDLRRGRVYHGTWGAAPFQRLYEPGPRTIYSLSLMPEWFLALPVLTGLSALGLEWRPLGLLALPLLAVALLVPVAQGWLSAGKAAFPTAETSRPRRLGMRILTAVLHILHPLARLTGRLQGSSARGPTQVGFAVPRPRRMAIWSERGESLEQRLHGIENLLATSGTPVRRGGEWDDWDLEVAAGALGRVRLIAAVEDHGWGAQLVRYRWWPSATTAGCAITLAFTGLALGAALDAAWPVAGVLAGVALVVALRIARQCGVAAAAVERAARKDG